MNKNTTITQQILIAMAIGLIIGSLINTFADTNEWMVRHGREKTPLSVEHQRENLERLMDYQDSRFISIIIEHIHEFDDLKKHFVALLKTLNPDKDQIVEMLFQIAIEDAPQTAAKNAARIALNINRQKSYDWIRNMMKMTTGKDRGDRKQSVNRRLMFIEVFGEMATPEDIPYLQELMKKDRSPRVKRRLVRMIDTQELVKN